MGAAPCADPAWQRILFKYSFQEWKISADMARFNPFVSEHNVLHFTVLNFLILFGSFYLRNSTISTQRFVCLFYVQKNNVLYRWWISNTCQNITYFRFLYWLRCGGYLWLLIFFQEALRLLGASARYMEAGGVCLKALIMVSVFSGAKGSGRGGTAGRRGHCKPNKG